MLHQKIGDRIDLFLTEPVSSYVFDCRKSQMCDDIKFVVCCSRRHLVQYHANSLRTAEA